MRRADILQQRGIMIVEYALGASDLAMLAAMFPSKSRSEPAALAADQCRQITSNEALSALVRELAGSSAWLTGAWALDDTPRSTWLTPWQRARAAELPGRGVILHIHLDAVTEDDGPLEAILGSHELGQLDRAGVRSAAANGESVLCLVDAGDIVVTRPGLIQRVQRPRRPARRRVIRLIYETNHRPTVRALAGLIPCGTA